jgi:hypothetical protein
MNKLWKTAEDAVFTQFVAVIGAFGGSFQQIFRPILPMVWQNVLLTTIYITIKRYMVQSQKRVIFIF